MQTYIFYAHGKSLFTAGFGLLEGVVQNEGHPREVPKVLQEGEEGEENRHRGQHDRYHPGQDPVDP